MGADDKLETKLAAARKYLAKAESDRETADRAEDYLREHAGGLGYGGSNAHKGANKIHAMSRRNSDRWIDANKRAQYWEREIKSYERRIAERDRVRLTREDIVGAVVIRTKVGWHKVVRVNKNTVSCESGYSWTDKIAFNQVLEARKAA
ncbi:hypothetical protein [Nocardia brasiliensis]|uniref:hypothetical protein n=1 Tax=Nocardia brasiliensis TaxID=37326 RepID=UPI002455427B|nr:hypothetical protein [Nocardia brasiliensis]